MGALPNDISVLNALKSIGENIIIADRHYHIRWMNRNAAELLAVIAPLYGLASSEDFVGKSMDYFHQQPEHQQGIMREIEKTFRSRITIKDSFIADIVVTPIKQNSEEVIEGYVVMLMDVTTKAEEEIEKETLIKALSTPILHVWDSTIALPVIGDFNAERADLLITSVLMECSSNLIEHVLIDLSGLSNTDSDVRYHIQKLYDCLRLIGSKCILVGISSELAISLGSLEREIQTFSTTYDGLKSIMALNNSNLETKTAY